jgi:hypothetical protein
MSEFREFEFTMTQGQYLFLLSANSTLPESLGTTKYEVTDRMIVNDMIRTLYRELREISPASERMPGKEALLLFGPSEAWVNDDQLKPEERRMMNPDQKVKIALSRDAVDGITWLMYMLLFPRQTRDGMSTDILPKEADRLVWPILEIVGRNKTIRENLGLNKIEKKHRWD